MPATALLLELNSLGIVVLAHQVYLQGITVAQKHHLLQDIHSWDGMSQCQGQQQNNVCVCVCVCACIKLSN